MLPSELSNLKLIPASDLRAGFQRIPPDPGVYLFFVRGGDKLLEETAYPDDDQLSGLTAQGWQHLYTGAATNLRFRVSQHFLALSEENSSPRKTLMAIEFLFGAVSNAVDSDIAITDHETMSEWMYENILVGFERHPKPFEREQHLLGRYKSPFNIAHRRRHAYSKWLMRWREDAFPPDWLQNPIRRSR
jgi:hypothetical protein